MNFNIQTVAMYVFFVFDTNGLIKVVYPLKIYRYIKVHGPRCLVQVLHPPQKFERPPFWNG
jgi:hypothetical protein